MTWSPIASGPAHGDAGCGDQDEVNAAALPSAAGRGPWALHLAWQARPNVHLAFRNAPVAQRLFPHCHLGITEYIHRWSGNDFAQIRAYHYNDIRGEPLVLASGGPVRRPLRMTGKPAAP